MREYCYLPRPQMGPGPWSDEPDHAQFERAGLPCLAVRHPGMGSWCGYAGVPPGHPLHGLHWNNDEAGLLDGAPAYYGVNYSAPCDPSGMICHQAEPGEAEPVWWFGMDFCHLFDLAPAMALRETKLGFASDPGESYRDLDFVKKTVGELADWLAAFRAAA